MLLIYYLNQKLFLLIALIVSNIVSKLYLSQKFYFSCIQTLTALVLSPNVEAANQDMIIFGRADRIARAKGEHLVIALVRNPSNILAAISMA